MNVNDQDRSDVVTPERSDGSGSMGAELLRSGRQPGHRSSPLMGEVFSPNVSVTETYLPNLTK